MFAQCQSLSFAELTNQKAIRDYARPSCTHPGSNPGTHWGTHPGCSRSAVVQGNAVPSHDPNRINFEGKGSFHRARLTQIRHVSLPATTLQHAWCVQHMSCELGRELAGCLLLPLARADCNCFIAVAGVLSRVCSLIARGADTHWQAMLESVCAAMQRAHTLWHGITLIEFRAFVTASALLKEE